jgi:hypothetical protein
MSIKYTGSGDPKNFIDPLARERIMHIDSKGGLSELYPKHPTHDELDLSIPLDATFDNGSNGAQHTPQYFGNNAADPPMTASEVNRLNEKAALNTAALRAKPLQQKANAYASEWADTVVTKPYKPYVLGPPSAQAQPPDVLTQAYSCKDCERRELRDEITQLRGEVFDWKSESRALRYELKQEEEAQANVRKTLSAVLEANDSALASKFFNERLLRDCRNANNLAAEELDKARNALKDSECARAALFDALMSKDDELDVVENGYDAPNNDYVLVRKRAEAAERDLAEAFEDLEVVFGALETEQKLHADARKEATSWKDAYHVVLGI